MIARPWTSVELTTLVRIVEDDLTRSACEKLFPNRTLESIRSKRRSIKKKYGLWGEKHSIRKLEKTKYYLAKYKPKHIVEAFSGRGMLSDIYSSFANSLTLCEYNQELYKKLTHKFRKDHRITIRNDRADRFLFDLYLSNTNNRKKYDWVDLDPFGSALHLMPTAVDLISHGYIYVTITDLHQLRFSKQSSLAWKMLYPNSLSGMPVEEQLSVLLGWLTFDLSKRFFWSETGYHRNPKKITPVAIDPLGTLNVRLYRVLFKVETVNSVKTVRDHLWKGLKLFRNGNIPQFDFNRINDGR